MKEQQPQAQDIVLDERPVPFAEPEISVYVFEQAQKLEHSLSHLRVLSGLIEFNDHFGNPVGIAWREPGTEDERQQIPLSFAQTVKKAAFSLYADLYEAGSAELADDLIDQHREQTRAIREYVVFNVSSVNRENQP